MTPQRSEGAPQGEHNRFGITKHGNRYLRTAFIEANQRGYRTTRLSKDVRLRPAHSAPEYVEIATRCPRRLSKTGNRLLSVGTRIAGLVDLFRLP